MLIDQVYFKDPIRVGPNYVPGVSHSPTGWRLWVNEPLRCINVTSPDGQSFVVPFENCRNWRVQGSTARAPAPVPTPDPVTAKKKK